MAELAASGAEYSCHNRHELNIENDIWLNKIHRRLIYKKSKHIEEIETWVIVVFVIRQATALVLKAQARFTNTVKTRKNANSVGHRAMAHVQKAPTKFTAMEAVQINAYGAARSVPALAPRARTVNTRNRFRVYVNSSSCAAAMMRQYFLSAAWRAAG